MIEPRLTSIVLLDGSQLDFLITSDFLTCDLLDMVCAHLSLTDKEYFGLSFMDHTGHRNWLQMEKKILDHDLAKKNGVLILFFSVKYFIESIAYTKDKNAVELFFLQSRLLIYQGDLELNNEIIFELGALVLQSLFGDFKNDKETIQNIKNQNILPKHFFANYNQVSSYCEPKIIGYYKKCSTLNRGQCIVNYLSIVEKLCNYGVHYYEVKDKTSTKCYLGVSYRGIGLYEANNKIVPKKIFPWSKLENLYYRDRKFSIEVHESQSINSGSSENTNELKNLQQQNQLNSQQTDEALNPVKVYTWFASIPSLSKSIWQMAVAQHQFYLDKKQNRHNILQFKSLNDLAAELNSKTSTQQSNKFNVGNIDNNISNGIKLKNTNPKLTNGLKHNDENTKSELLNLFKKQRELLQKRLELKKKLCENVKSKQKDIQEMAQQAINDKTQINKLLKLLADYRNNNLNSNNNRDKNIIVDNLCQESDIQKKIMYITLNLASDPHVSYIVQKQRREFYEKTKKKLAKLEKKLEKETSIQKEAFLDSKSNTSNDKNETFYHSNSEVKLKQIDENSAEISPASIHRKDSYRRAQEQKLFLDSGEINNMNKQNRLAAARKVKTILNNDQNVLPQPPLQTQSQTQLIPIQQNAFIDNTNFNTQQSENQVKVIKIGNNFKNNFIPEEQVSNGLLIEGKPRKENIPDGNTRNFYLQDDFLDYDLRNYNPQQTNSLNHHSNQNIPQTDFITFRNQRNSRKNTSDSNVKLLADHNFYHVTNRRQVNQDFQSRETFACPDLVEPNSCLIKNGYITHPNKLISNKPYELSDYFKYSSKFKRGMNSSSNSLISLNSSSAGTNEDSGNNNSDKDIIRSNPDLKMNCLSSPQNQTYVIQQIRHQNSIKNLTQLNTSSINSTMNVNSNNNLLNSDHLNTAQKYDYYSNHSFNKSDLTNLSNNLSLNLSIHTAEEFGIEMLEWLNNETSTNGLNNLIDSKLATNATLV